MPQSTTTRPKRTEVPHEQTWDIEAMFATPDDWKAEIEALPQAFPSLKAFKGQLSSPESLLKFLEHKTDLELRLSKAGGYSYMTASVDSTDTEAAGRADVFAGVMAQFASAIAFANPELLELEESLCQWIKQPEFANYRVSLERLLRSKPHVRHAEVEEILGQLNAPFSSANRIHSILANMDFDFGTAGGEKIGQGTVGRLLGSENRNTRREAWEHYCDAHLAAKHAQAAMYTTSVRQKAFMARTRHFPDILTASLAPKNIPNEVVTTLLDTYQEHLPTWHKYWKIRQQWLRVPELCEYDVFAPLGKKPQISYSQAVEWIIEGMAPLGADYVRDMQAGLTSERWVDYAANEGKRQGAYSSGAGRIKPYIFMTWNDSMGSYSTLAHEIGHSMHSWLAMHEQPAGVPRYTLFHAEVASNFNQAMVRHHLLNKARENNDRDLEIALIEEAMANFHRYFFLMPTLTAFELEIYKRIEAGKPVSAPDLIELNADLLAQGYGESVKMDRQRGGSMWMQFSTHIYADFYPYQYATGISAAHQLREQFDTDEAAARERYLRFLKSGGSLDPIEALQQAGVDMLSPEPVTATFRTLAGYVDRLEELMNQS